MRERREKLKEKIEKEKDKKERKRIKKIHIEKMTENTLWGVVYIVPHILLFGYILNFKFLTNRYFFQ